MNSVKILHCADLHFDTPFSNLPIDKANIRRDDLRATFSNIIELAIKDEVDIILIAGDLFDNDMVNSATINHIISKIKTIPDKKIFISPGNHDYYNHKSFYHLTNWPSNVYIFKNEFEVYKLVDKNVNIFGIGFSSRYHRDTLLRNLPVLKQDEINILLMHGDVVGNGQSSDYNPISIIDLENSGFDYIALGHKHDYSGIQKSKSTYWAYPGTPEGRSFAELNDRGIIIGSISKGMVDLDFKSICKRKYFKLKIDVSNLNTYDDIIDKIKDSITKYDNYSLHNFHITLIGDMEKEFTINKELIKSKLANVAFYIIIIDETKVKRDYEILSQEISLRGIFVSKMLEKINLTDDENKKSIYHKALEYGLKALENEEVLIG